MELKKKKNDYLKYWRVIRYFIKAKYKISQADLDILLFLYSEKYFDKDRFDDFGELLPWENGRFDRLRKEGWIDVFRPRRGRHKAMYQVSYKASRMIYSMYEKLNGEEIPVSNSCNPMFLKNVKYSDKVYRNMIKDMNEFIRQQRHHVPE